MDSASVSVYVLYKCTVYRHDSVRSVLRAVFNYNRRCGQKIKLILSGVPAQEYRDREDWINVGFAAPESCAYIENIKAVILDDVMPAEKSDVLKYFERGILCLTNARDEVLKALFVKENCGFYYSDTAELMAVLLYLFDEENSHCLASMQRNACEYAKKNSLQNGYSPITEKRMKNRMAAIEDMIKAKRDSNIPAGEKVQAITSAVKDSDRKLLFVCPDDMSMNNIKLEFLLIFQYIKLYINPNAQWFFSGTIKREDAAFQLLNAQISEFSMHDIYFDKPDRQLFMEADRILLTFYDVDEISGCASDFHYVITMGMGELHGNMIRADFRNIRQTAELVGTLLYDKGELQNE